ncbi:DUF4435 domain-containing protein [Rothia mucilaginosa]|jgi:hypothetical protein|uniref:hypothetical protein n=1 Tax=Rothia mucilaginosa TaxID=43675 RepID=UPI00352D1B70
METSEELPYKFTKKEAETSAKLSRSGSDRNSLKIFEIFVEGDSDVRFFKRWLKEIKTKGKVKFKVKTITKSSLLVKGHGNRGTVIATAEATKDDVYTMYIADRDIWDGDMISQYSNIEALFFTDFPAIESYGLMKPIFKEVNYRRFDGDCKNMEDYYAYITYIVRILYLIRCHFSKKMSIYSDFWRVLEDAIKSEVVKNNLPSESYKYIMHTLHDKAPVEVKKSGILDDSSLPSDIREHAYGHDIAPIVRNFISSQCHESNLPNSYIERALVNVYIDLGYYKEDSLFKAIQEYVEKKMEMVE